VDAYPVRLIAALAGASALSVAALLVEIGETGSSFYRFLVWNLFLAWVPLAAALACYGFARVRAYGLAVGAGVVWLLFFPNAPYMLTDYVHIREIHPTSPVWWDALMLSSFVWTGLMLGFASLFLMQSVWRAHVGRISSWLLVVLALALASFGVYLGPPPSPQRGAHHRDPGQGPGTRATPPRRDRPPYGVHVDRLCGGLQLPRVRGRSARTRCGRA
jgi:hypothetical protein